MAESLSIPVLGSGDCIEPEQVLARLRGGSVSGVLVGRGVLRSPWILAQAQDLAAGRPMREITLEDRGRFLVNYIELLLNEGENEAEGFRHQAGQSATTVGRDFRRADRGRERWVINKVRALMSWYSKGLHNGGHLRTAINSATCINQVRDIVEQFFSIAETAMSVSGS